MIPPNVLASIKERTDLVALIGDSVRLTRRGNSFVGLCPFHEEKSPSFHVNQERGRYHCFGCKDGGGAIDFVMKTEGQTFHEAVHGLAERAGIEIPDAMTDTEKREAQAVRKATDDMYAVTSVAAGYFEQCLRGGPATSPHAMAHHAVEELARRGLSLETHDETLRAFRIGYAPFGWDGLATYLRQQGISPVHGERVGLLVPRQSGTGYYDRFRHRLMFAVSDVMGRVIAFSGRALPDPDPAEIASLGISGPSPQADGPPAKYINSPESPIYTKGEHLFGLHQARQSVRQRGEAILVEGNFDVVALQARGVSSAVAPLGTAFTSAQAKLIKRFAPAVVLLFDGDSAGKKATWAARVPCRECGLSARVGTLPRGADPDALAKSGGAASVEAVLLAAKGLREHLLQSAMDPATFARATIEERHARFGAVTALMAEEVDPMLRQMVKLYVDQLASGMMIDGKAPSDMRQLEQMLTKSVKPAAVSHDAESSAMLGALIDWPSILDEAAVAEAVDTAEGDMALAVVAVRRWSGRAGVDLVATVPPSLRPFVSQRLAVPLFAAADDATEEVLESARKATRRAKRLQRVEAMGRLVQP